MLEIFVADFVQILIIPQNLPFFHPENLIHKLAKNFLFAFFINDCLISKDFFKKPFSQIYLLLKAVFQLRRLICGMAIASFGEFENKGF